MTINEIVAALPVATIEAYAATDISEQFEFARDVALNNDFNTMDHYDAFEIALDTRATEMGIF